jgi:asparagine synthetase B (glutamine-hydrolysing)
MMPFSVSNSQLGNFTVFGFTHDSAFIKHLLPFRLGINPQAFPFGSQGQIFFFTSHGDVAETEDTIVLKHGFLRSRTKSALTARQLLEEKLVGPQSIVPSAFSGNALVIGLSKTEPVFSAFKTLMAAPQLYFFISDDGIVCSDVLRCLVRIIPHRALNESILPQHFLFRSVYGSSTYYRGVERLMAGHQLKWVDGNIATKLARSLDVVVEESQFIRNDSSALNKLGETMQDVVGDYIDQIEKAGEKFANLLSGGVDSTLLQYFINSKSSDRPSRSISYAIRVPTFEFEIDYARRASQLLNTNHTFVEYTPQDYPDLLIRAVEILAQPPNLETEPSTLALIEFAHAANWPEKFFFTGLSADSLFGERESTKLKGLQYFRKMPFAVFLLKRLGAAMAPVTSRSQTLLKGAEIISSGDNPDSDASPLNFFRVFVFGEDREIIRRCFGDQALREALEYRRNLAAQYSRSQHYLDRVHFIDLLTDTYEIAVQRQQLFLAYQFNQIDPFTDEDLLKTALTFHPDMRYIKGFRYKHLLKNLLKQKTNAPVAHQRKGGSGVNDELVTWMRSGPLRPLVEDIRRPDFMCKADFEHLIQKPNHFLWHLLTFDLFHKSMIM